MDDHTSDQTCDEAAAGERFLAAFREHHGDLADPALEWFGTLGPVERRSVNLLDLSEALHYLEVARVVLDLADPDEGFEAFAHLTENLGLPDAAELVERAALPRT